MEVRGERPVMLSSGPVALANGTVLVRLATRKGLLAGSVLRASCRSRRLTSARGIWRLVARRFTFDVPVRAAFEPRDRAVFESRDLVIFLGFGLAR
jgi:hypothetical protein